MTKRVVVRSISSTPPAGTGSMFRNAKHTRVENSSFTISTTNVYPGTTQVLSILYNRVAPNAILNAGGRADEVRCLPGTREEVIGRIEKWRVDVEAGRTASRLFWLSGPAGAGKTAIVQTVAENWKSRGVHTANFFFFRTDSSRNHPGSLVSTILYQIFDFYPDLREVVEAILTSKPRIMEASIKEQFDQLISFPLRSVGPPFLQPIVLLIDGLDECDSEEKTSQRHILHVVGMLVSQTDLPFLVLVGSRDEHQITTAFKELGSTVDSIFLDDQYSPDKDIRLFVVAEFDRIKRTHRLAPQDENWPSTSDVNNIVTRSSGQFIYAATVMRFIFQSSAHPMLSLARVQGAAQIAVRSPFSHLDAMYTYILTRAEDQEALKDILCAHIVCMFRRRLLTEWAVVPVTTLRKVLCLYNNKYTDSDIHSCIADINTISRLEDGKLSFYHSSLDDYLKTQSRSGQYYCDVDAFMTRILPGVWKLTRKEPDEVLELAMACMAQLSRGKTITPDFWSALLSLSPSDYDGLLPDYLDNIYTRCIGDVDLVNYRRLLRKWSSHYISVGCSNFVLGQLYRLPHGAGYMTMARIDQLHGDIKRDPMITADTLRPESTFDTHEIALWIHNLLWRIHREHYPRLEIYKGLVGQWISWALSNDIALTNLDELPYGQQCLQQGMVNY